MTIAVDVPVVTLDVIATTKNGDILTGLKKENFKVFDEGAPQTITNFAPTDAPITMVIVMEFSGRAYGWFACLCQVLGGRAVSQSAAKGLGSAGDF